MNEHNSAGPAPRARPSPSVKLYPCEIIALERARRARLHAAIRSAVVQGLGLYPPALLRAPDSFGVSAHDDLVAIILEQLDGWLSYADIYCVAENLRAPVEIPGWDVNLWRAIAAKPHLIDQLRAICTSWVDKWAADPHPSEAHQGNTCKRWLTRLWPATTGTVWA